MTDIFHRINNILTHINFKNNDKKYSKIFKELKPFIIERIHMVLINRRIKQTGRPITTNFDQLLDALFYLCDSGAQTHYITEHYGISKGTFYRYLKMISEHHILEDLYQSIIEHIPLTEHLITDTFNVKSMRGSDGLGRNPTDRGRNGLKVSVICDTNRITREIHIGSANTHDSKLLLPTIKHHQGLKSLQEPIKCLCDAGYVGHQLACECQKENISLIVRPKKVGKSGRWSHQLNHIDQIALDKYRNRIELLNGNIRRFRGLMVKWVTTISTYHCFLYVSLLCITCYQISII